jgi:hypothetical protein
MGAVLGFELRALCLLGEHSTIGAMYPTLFALAIFQILSCIFALVARIIDMYHHAPQRVLKNNF